MILETNIDHILAHTWKLNDVRKFYNILLLSEDTQFKHTSYCSKLSH